MSSSAAPAAASRPPVEECVLTATDLRKSYGELEAVRGLTLSVRRGELFGFLGPNGAGKSTTMRMMATVSLPTSGDLTVLGLNPRTHGSQIRSRLGVCPQDNTIDTELNVIDNLLVYGAFFGISRERRRARAEELLEFVDLSAKHKARPDDLSGGMKRRLIIARALMNAPELLLLDEPTTALDPQARHLLWDQLYRLKHEGVTQILTTHYMDEAEQLCDRLVIIDDGRIVAEGTPAGLIAQHASGEVVELRFGATRPGDTAELARRMQGCGDRIEPLADRVLVHAPRGDDALAAVKERGIEPASALVRRSTLEDVFLRLTGRQLVD